MAKNKNVFKVLNLDILCNFFSFCYAKKLKKYNYNTIISISKAKQKHRKINVRGKKICYANATCFYFFADKVMN